MSVDLPAPFSPMMACTSPRLTSKSTLNSTGTSLNDFEIRLAARIAGVIAPTAFDMLCCPPPGSGQVHALFARFRTSM